ncbi:MAG: hypothetical protein Q9227_001724 [Pyrenula ochraceoflavens]
MNSPPTSSKRHPLHAIGAGHANTRRLETPLLKKIAQGRISKNRSAPASRLEFVASRQQTRQLNIETRKFDNPQQFQYAVHVFTKLARIPHLSTRAPKICGQDLNRLEIELKYPAYPLWRVFDRLLKRPYRNEQLGVKDLRQLREDLLSNISILYDSQIAFDADVSTLRMAHRSARPSIRPSKFLPFFDTFDLGVSTQQNDDSINWAELRDSAIRKAQSQFDVLEFLALAKATPEIRAPEFAPDPETVVHILSSYTTISSIQVNPLLRHVNKRTAEFDHLTAKHIAGLLQAMTFRNFQPQRPDPRLPNDRDTVTHVLRLGSNDTLAASCSGYQLAGRAALWVVYTAILIHMYANVIEVGNDYSRGLVEFEYSDELADSFTSWENFSLVSEAARKAGEAVRTLYASGGDLDPDIRSFINKNCLPPAAHKAKSRSRKG